MQAPGAGGGCGYCGGGGGTYDGPGGGGSSWADTGVTSSFAAAGPAEGNSGTPMIEITYPEGSLVLCSGHGRLGCWIWSKKRPLAVAVSTTECISSDFAYVDTGELSSYLRWLFS